MKYFLIIRETRSTKELDAFWEKARGAGFTQPTPEYILNGETQRDWRGNSINQVAMTEMARERAVAVAARTNIASGAQPNHFSLYIQTGPEARNRLETIIQVQEENEEVQAAREIQGKNSQVGHAGMTIMAERQHKRE